VTPVINAGGTSVPYRAWYSLTGVLIVLAGVALVVAGLWQHRHVLRTLRSDVAEPLPEWPVTMRAVAVAAGVALSTCSRFQPEDGRNCRAGAIGDRPWLSQGAAIIRPSPARPVSARAQKASAALRFV
jgi:hypothetical protein